MITKHDSVAMLERYQRLTARQVEVLDYIRAYIAEHDGRAPGQRAMRRDMRMGQGQLVTTLDKLVLGGLLETGRDGSYRSLRLAEER